MINTIMSALSLLLENKDAFISLGVDVAGAISKGTSLITSDTASTPDERAAALATIQGMQTEFSARLEELKSQGVQ